MGITLARPFEKILGRTDVKILIVGLKAAGKTTILYRFKMEGSCGNNSYTWI